MEIEDLERETCIELTVMEDDGNVALLLSDSSEEKRLSSDPDGEYDEEHSESVIQRARDGVVMDERSLRRLAEALALFADKLAILAAFKLDLDSRLMIRACWESDGTIELCWCGRIATVLRAACHAPRSEPCRAAYRCYPHAHELELNGCP